MAPYTRGKKRDQTRFVKANSVILYGFKTKDLAAATGISQADLNNQLGHLDTTAAEALAGGIRVIGINSPKPPRVSKRIPNATLNQPASVSTFCSFDKIAASAAGGWGLIKAARGVSLQPNVPGRRTVTAIAALSNLIKYAFPMNAADFEFAKAALGLQQSSQLSATERSQLITGSSSTRPGRASIQLETGILTAFYSTDSGDDAAAAGWAIVEGERVYDPLSGGA
jgi:hypothetical protein